MSTSIWWIRRDLRLNDNEALNAALTRGGEYGQVIPLYIIDPNLWQGKWFSSRRAAFLVENLRALDTALRKRGSYLVVRYGAPLETLARFTTKHQAKQIFSEQDYSPYASKRDTALIKEGLPLTQVGGTMHHHPDTILKVDGTPYQVFTPFMRRWKSLLEPSPDKSLPAPTHIPTPGGIKSMNLPELRHTSNDDFPAGEEEALRRLNSFTEGMNTPIYQYGQHRDRPDLHATSQLSPYLRFGLISNHQAIRAALDATQNATDEVSRTGAETWLNELIWREFYQYILYHFPHALRQSFRPKYRDLRWINDAEDFDAWKAGQTGYPIIDAAMRQLANTGWMHNRARMLTASFLVKNLMIDWRWGEAWFMKNLLDGDPAPNNGGWQWTAGTGTDAAPYFRIFNPITQSRKFDPQGTYIRRWLPELRNVPDNSIHTPWKMSVEEQTNSGCEIGNDYPAPIIDLKFSRQRALDFYKQAVNLS